MVGTRKCNELLSWHGSNCAALYLLSKYVSEVWRNIAPSKLYAYRIAFQDDGCCTISEVFVCACDKKTCPCSRAQTFPDTSMEECDGVVVAQKKGNPGIGGVLFLVLLFETEQLNFAMKCGGIGST